MAYKHGVYMSEIPTSILPPVETEAGLPVIYGTAPVHLASDRAKANRPVLCYSYAEAVAAFGYSNDWKNYTLCEAIYSEFALFNVSPVVLVNVLDPETHKKVVSNTAVPVTNGVAKVTDSVLIETLVVSSGDKTLTAGEDYEAAYDDKEVLNITALSGGKMESLDTISVSYTALDPSEVKADDIIGGISTDGTSKGLETLDQVFPLFRMVPGLVLAPGWSQHPEVAAVMASKAGNINSHFKALALVDVPTDTVTKYTDVPAWKNDNNYTNENEVAFWPCVKLGEKVYHLSTQMAGVCGQVDAAHDDIPYKSPSNESLQADGLCLTDGTEIILSNDQANYLNGQGIVTGLNFIGGWKLWGNRTACYPGNTDPKDAFISIRRMFNWHWQTFIQTYWSRVDAPINKRLIQTIVDSENIRLNGLVAQGAILGGRVTFESSENPTTSLIDGKIKFHTYFTPPTPAREIEDELEYDPDYFSTLFENA